jgi:hypothetical protein
MTGYNVEKLEADIEHWLSISPKGDEINGSSNIPDQIITNPSKVTRIFRVLTNFRMNL